MPDAGSDLTAEGGGLPTGWILPPRYVLLTFTGHVTPKPLIPGQTYYRPIGEGSVPAGSWWTATPPTAADRAGLAIKGSWNSMTGVVQFTPRAHVVIPAWHGAAAPQAVVMPDGKPGYLLGGNEVIWVPRGALSKDAGVFTLRPMNGRD
jgi:hypothetical protein